MAKKKAITIYKDKNVPYKKSFIDGLNEGPEKRFVKDDLENERY